jgi:ribosomal protein S18 acetylase RimI-like enzyme
MVSIQKVDTAAISVIKELAYKIWPTAYKDILSAEQMKYMLDLFYSESSLQKQMQEAHQFILAQDENNAVGFASYSSKNNNGTIYRLHKIYIDPNQQGKGIGKILIDYICNDIKPKGATNIELNVNRYNKAIQFYQKIGFTITKEEDIDIGNGYFMNDYILKYEL